MAVRVSSGWFLLLLELLLELNETVLRTRDFLDAV